MRIIAYSDLYLEFGWMLGDEDWTPRYKIVPIQPIPVIRQHPKEVLEIWTSSLLLLRTFALPRQVGKKRRLADLVATGQKKGVTDGFQQNVWVLQVRLLEVAYRAVSP
jgi:hypothetical protein